MGRHRGVALAAATCVALGTVLAPTASADDRSCTSTSATTTICSRPGGGTSINTSPQPVGTYTACGFGTSSNSMCGGGVTWNIGGIFNNRR